MSLFFLACRIIRLAYVTLRAAAGIMIVSHGVHQWVKKHKLKQLSYGLT